MRKRTTDGEREKSTKIQRNTNHGKRTSTQPFYSSGPRVSTISEATTTTTTYDTNTRARERELAAVMVAAAAAAMDGGGKESIIVIE